MKKNNFILLLIIILFGITTSLAQTEEMKNLEEQKLMIDALKSFIDNDPKAADEMEYIIQNRETAAREKANRLLEQMAVEETETKESELNFGELDFISRKLNMALVYFYETKYYLTIQECNNVLRIEPKNTLAWIRRGSGYYMLQNFEQARKDWEIALQLKPNEEQRKDLEKYLSKLYSEDKI